MCPNVRGALAFAVESQDGATAAAVALGAVDLDDDMSTAKDRQLSRTVRASTSLPQQEAMEASRVGASCTKKENPYTAGRAHSLLRDPVSTANEVA